MAQQKDSSVDRARLEAITGHPVSDLSLFARALTHRSLLRGETEAHRSSNERLEFLGDAILGALIAEHLFREFPEKPEGYLTRLRAKIVNRTALAEAARAIDLGPLLALSDNMERSGGRNNTTILSDAFEAVLGAIYLDQGLEAARRFVEKQLLAHLHLPRLAMRTDNYKSRLLEYAQARAWPQPTYRTVEEEGPAHQRTFTVEVLVRQEVCGSGQARSKKDAEQQAARVALRHLRKNEKAASEA